MGAWLAPGLWEETLPQRPPEAAGRQAAQEAWPRRRDLDFLSASREPGQVVALCLSHSPPAFPASTHTEAPSPHRLPAQAPLSLCEPQGLTSQAGMHSAICSEGCGGAAGWGKGRAEGGVLWQVGRSQRCRLPAGSGSPWVTSCHAGLGSPAGGRWALLGGGPAVSLREQVTGALGSG